MLHEALHALGFDEGDMAEAGIGDEQLRAKCIR